MLFDHLKVDYFKWILKLANGVQWEIYECPGVNYDMVPIWLRSATCIHLK